MNQWMLYATITMAVATIVIAIAAIAQACFSKRLAALQKTIDEDRKRVDLVVDFRWLRDEKASVHIVNNSHVSVTITRVELIAGGAPIGKTKSKQLPGMWQLRPFGGEVKIEDEQMLKDLVEPLFLAMRPTEVEITLALRYRAHAKDHAATYVIFQRGVTPPAGEFVEMQEQ